MQLLLFKISRSLLHLGCTKTIKILNSLCPEQNFKYKDSSSFLFWKKIISLCILTVNPNFHAAVIYKKVIFFKIFSCLVDSSRAGLNQKSDLSGVQFQTRIFTFFHANIRFQKKIIRQLCMFQRTFQGENIALFLLIHFEKKSLKI